LLEALEKNKVLTDCSFGFDAFDALAYPHGFNMTDEHRQALQRTNAQVWGFMQRNKRLKRLRAIGEELEG
jgi:hypothetical protein